MLLEGGALCNLAEPAFEIRHLGPLRHQVHVAATHHAHRNVAIREIIARDETHLAELLVENPTCRCGLFLAGVDRDALLKALAGFLKANKLNADWDGIEKAPNEALVNALAMMSPYGPAEKQAMLEAPDLKRRAEILVALTEMELAKNENNGETKLQ